MEAKRTKVWVLPQLYREYITWATGNPVIKGKKLERERIQKEKVREKASEREREKRKRGKEGNRDE